MSKFTELGELIRQAYLAGKDADWDRYAVLAKKEVIKKNMHANTDLWHGFFKGLEDGGHRTSPD